MRITTTGPVHLDSPCSRAARRASVLRRMSAVSVLSLAHCGGQSHEPWTTHDSRVLPGDGQLDGGAIASSDAGQTSPFDAGAALGQPDAGYGADGSLAAHDAGADGDAAAEGDAGVALGACEVAALTPCGSFTTPTGTHIDLGPYGAQMDVNVGQGFENEIQSGDMPGNEIICQFFAGVFQEDQKLTDRLLDTSQDGITLDFSLYTVYRPAIWPDAKLPVITWGNGTCAQPEGYGALLRYVASYGYFVVAANSRWVQSGTPAPMLHALDFAAAANADPSSPYYQKLDLDHVGAMGHSQGGAATISASSDSRVKDVIVFNGGDTGVSKPYLAISGDMDVVSTTPADMASDIDAASVPAAWLYEHDPAGMGPLRGHLVLMLSPDRLTSVTVAWWEMMFHDDSASRALFVGPSCGLCTSSSEYEYGEHGL
jgi:hypothetical protein